MQSSSNIARNPSYCPGNLPTKTQSPFTVEIDLDQQIYNPGQSINGQLKLILNKKLNCNLLSVQLYGSARVFFTEMQKTPGNVGQTKAYEQEIVFVNSKTDLWVAYEKDTQESPKRQITLDEIARLASPNTIRMPSNTLIMNGDAGKENLGLNAGIHEFKFSFKLPEEQALYTSFDAKNSAGCVRYYIIVQAFNSGHSTLKRKLLFPVVCHKNLGKDPVLAQVSMQTINLEKSKVLDRGIVTAKLHLTKRGYVPGEPLQGHITIDNRSPKSIKYASLHIVQRTVCYSKRPEIKVHESYFETPGMGLPKSKILANSSLIYLIKFYVPALLPNLSVPECIEADYCLCLDVDWKRTSPKRNFLQIKTPIIIGTHPTNELPGQLSPLPPPPYEESANGGTHTFADMPPSYAVSVGGVSELGSKEAQNTLLNASINGNYAPVCYHYNYAFAQEDDENGKQSEEKKKLD